MSRLSPLVVVLASLLVGLCASESHARSEAPRSYSQLQRSLKGASDDKRIKVMRTFARDRRPALSERLRAAAAYRRLLDKDDAQLVRAWLLEAHLQGVGGASGLRNNALRRAKAAALASQQESTAKHLDTVLAAEEALSSLELSVEKQERAAEPRPRTAAEDALVERLRAALPSWNALKDARSVGLARMWIARSDAAVPGGEADALRELSNLVRTCGSDRDCSAVRAEVRRARARLLAKSGDWDNAVHEMLVADRAALVPPTLPRFEAPPKTPYGKTRATAELCFAAREHGVSCGDVEMERMGARSFYDFSRETPHNAFDEERAMMVAHEYTPLLVDCIKAGIVTGDTRDTTVQLEWSIGHNGKVRGFTVNPRRLRKTAFEKCTREAFDVFRYPPYRGEMKHMGNSFNVPG